MTAHYGLNTVEAIATSGVGKTTRRTVGFYYSTAYAPYATPISDTTKIPDALIMRLSQKAVDDGDRSTPANDIATLGEITLNNLDLQSSIGSVPIFQRTVSFLTKSYGYTCTDCLSITGLTIGGTIKLTGDVVITSEITELDFNALKLALATKTGGLKADVDVDEIVTPPKPGFLMTLHTSARAPVIAKFDQDCHLAGELLWFQHPPGSLCLTL